MANYQPSHSLTLSQIGENNTGAQSTGAARLAQHVQGEIGYTPAHPLSSHTLAANAANAADQAAGARSIGSHSAIRTNSTHTCATCKVTCRNNFTLEKHASKERHKSFMCTCTTGFMRLATLNRHIAAQAGPKHYCDYCDDNKGFAREDKFVDHLRGSHKFGDKVIAQIRSQTRVQPEATGRGQPTVGTTGVVLPVSTSAGFDAAAGIGQGGYSAGTSAGPAGIVDGGLDDFSMFSGAGAQPFGLVEDHPFFGASEDLTSFDFSGIDFAGVDFASFVGDLNMSGMDNSM